VVRGVGRGISVLDGGSTSYKGKGRFWGVLFQIFTIGFFIRSPTEKCFRFVCENLIRYPFGKYITGELNSLAFRGYIQIRYLSCGLREIIKNVTVIMRQHYGTLHRREVIVVIATTAARRARLFCAILGWLLSILGGVALQDIV